jgi:hypothetical protein
MYKLIIENNGLVISTITLSNSPKGLRNIIDLFESKLNINIGNYHISKTSLKPDSFTVSLNDEELSEWRDNRIKGLIK